MFENRLVIGYLRSMLSANEASFLVQVNEHWLDWGKHLLNELQVPSSDREKEYITYINNGALYMCDIIRTGFCDRPEEREHYLQAIVSVIWYLFICALYKGQAFTQGIIVVTNRPLYDFFMDYIRHVNPNHTKLVYNGVIGTNPFAYPRRSSHFNGVSPSYQQYGIDIRFDPKGAAEPLLPGKKTHILLIPLDEDNGRFALHIEDAGIFIGEKKQWIFHALGYLSLLYKKITGAVDDPQMRREQVPKAVRKKFHMLLAKLGSTLPKNTRSRYRSGARHYGIQAMIGIGKNLLACARGNENWYEDLAALVAQLEDEFDQTDRRFGREVILNEDELRAPIE